MKLLTPKGWFEKGYDFLWGQTNFDDVWLPGYSPGTIMWAPPPGGDSRDLEELQQARQKRQKFLHIFVCPCLLFTKCRRPFYHSYDMIIKIKAGSCYFWTSGMHETLIVALLFSYISRDPW